MPARKESAKGWEDVRVSPDSHAITRGLGGVCAKPAIGHVTIALLAMLRNSRRLMLAPQGSGAGILGFKWVCGKIPRRTLWVISDQSAAQQDCALFDHFVGTSEQRLRHSKAECLRGF